MADGMQHVSRARRQAVEPNYAPEGLSRGEAARYVGVSPTTFDLLVKTGEMPAARRYRGALRIVWLRRELDRALEDLPVDAAHSPAPHDPVDL